MKSAPVSDGELTFMDADTGETVTLGGNALKLHETSITFSTLPLRENRHYNVTITASNADCSALSDTQIS